MTHEVETDVLEEIAAAVSSKEVEQILDVSIVQMFLSRTIQQSHRRGSPCKVSVDSVRINENEEEDDEL